MRAPGRLFRWWSLLIIFLSCMFGRAGAASLSDYYAYQTISLGGGKPVPEREVGKHYASLRYAMTLDINRNLISPAFSILGENSGGDNPNFDVGVLYGRRLVGRRGYLYAGAGVALAHAVQRRIVHHESYYYSYDEMKKEVYRILGVPWDVSATWMPDESFGLLIQIFGDINRRQSFWGWGVGLHLGG